MASSITCSGGWLLTDETPGPLPSPSLKLTGVFLVVIVLGLAIGWALRGGATGVDTAEIGQPAPRFVVDLLDGGRFSLDDVEGPIVVNFWASWCIPCRTEIPEISRFAEAHPEVTVIGIAVEDVESAARDFADEVDASYPLAFGNEEIERAYPRIGLPVTYFLDEGHVVTHVFNGIITEADLAGLLG